MKKDVKTTKKMILTSKLCAKDPLAGQNTQQARTNMLGKAGIKWGGGEALNYLDFKIFVFV